MDDYPKNLIDFERSFATEQACIDYLADLKYPEGFRCPKCGGRNAWTTGGGMMCTACHQRVSVKTGTIFQDSKIPLHIWFLAAWWVVGQKNGYSAKSLHRQIGFGSYETAWIILHKLRRAMVFQGRKMLSGVVEVDETYIGGYRPGKAGRGAEGKVLAVVAVEDLGQKGFGRIRLEVVDDASSESLIGFAKRNIMPGSKLRTDGWSGYAGADTFKHKPTTKDLKLAHRVIALLKRWLGGTHQGAVSHEHLQSYLDEFVFRFNRRTSKSRGLLFRRLLENAVKTPPAPYKSIVKNIRIHKP
jgi:transposase-like protein